MRRLSPRGYLALLAIVLAISKPASARKDEKIAAGSTHSAVLRGGTLSTTGDDSRGQLGVGVDRNVFEAALSSWRHLALGTYITHGLKDDSTLWASGTSSTGGLGLGAQTFADTLTQVGSAKWITIAGSAARVSHTMGIKADSTLWAWGAHGSGRLGNGTTSGSTLTPAQLGTAKWLDVAVGQTHSAGIQADSSLWVWGAGTSGQVGHGVDINQLTPVKIGTDQWIQVKMGSNFTIAVRADSTLWGWGLNTGYQLGLGNASNLNVPTQIGSSKWMDIRAGNTFAAGLRNDSTLWAWGTVTNGAFGDGTSGTVVVTGPAQIGSSKWRDLALGTQSILARNSSNAYQAWGLNANGQLGDGTNGDQTSPVTIVPVAGSQSITFGTLAAMTVGDADVAPGATASSGLTVAYASSDVNVATIVSGQIHAVGAGTATITASQAGNADYAAATSATQSLTVAAAPVRPSRDRKIAVGFWHSAIIKSGVLSSTGLGLGGVSSQLRFRKISAGWRHVAAGQEYMHAIKDDSTLWAAGKNTWGVLGIGSTSWQDTLVQVGSAKWLTVAGTGMHDQHTMGIQADSTLWGWGHHYNGRVGNGQTTGHSLVPVQIGSGKWMDVTTGLYYSAGIMADSSIWTWGNNGSGELGNGGTSPSSSPVKIGTSKWIDVEASNGFTLAIRNDSTLWGWGGNQSKQLGINSGTNYYYSPVQIGSDKWIAVGGGYSHAAGIKSDSTMWTWGYASSGSHGTGGSGTIWQNTPTQVGSSKWTALAVGRITTLARNASASLYGWGFNGNAQIGDGTVTSRYSPVVIMPPGLDQSITFPALPAKTIGDADFAVGASVNTGFPLTYASSDTNVATLVGSQIHITGAGSANITVSQAGDTAYASADSIRVLTVGKRSQTISFAGLSGKAYLDTNYSPGATASSGLAVTYASSDTAVATIVGSSIHIVAPGTTTITASQAGNGEYLAAADSARTLTAGKAAQSALALVPISDKTLADDPISLGVTGGSGTGTVTYSVDNGSLGSIASGVLTLAGAGTLIVTATKAADANYTAATANDTLTISKASQSITFAALSAKTWLEADFAPGATASSGLTVTYTSSDNAVATIVSGNIHLVGAGTAVITASQAGNATYDSAASVSQTFTVGKSAQAITFATLLSKVYGDSNFVLTAASSSGLGVIYLSSNPAVATVTGSTVHIVGPGSTTLTVSQAGGPNHHAAMDVAQTFLIGAAGQAITFAALPSKLFGDADFAPGATAASGLAVSSASSNPAVATIVSGQIHIVGAGTAIITASQSGNAFYSAAPEAAQTLVVAKAAQSITFAALPAKVPGDADFAPGASAGSSLPITYSSSDTLVAKIVGGLIHVVGVGNAIITASQAGDANFLAAVYTAQAIYVAQANQTLTFLELPGKTFGDAAFALAATAASALPVAFASSNPSVAVIEGDTVRIVGAGSATLTASQAGNATFSPALPVARIVTVAKSAQTLTLPALVPKIFGDPDFALSAASTSGLTPEFSITDTLVARIVTGKIHLVGEGITAITWTQSGDSNYLPATVAAQNLTVGRAFQSLTFNLGSDTLKTLGDSAFTLIAVSSDGLPVGFTSSDTTVVAVHGNKALILKPGTVTLTALQPGNAQYAPAPAISRSLRVRVAAPSSYLAAELLPAQGRVIDTAVTLAWPAKPGAAAYRVVASLDTLQTATLVDRVLQDTTFTVGRLAFGAGFHWRIAALNATGSSVFSPFLSYQVRPLPPVPLDAARIPSFPEAGVGKQVEIAWPKVEGVTGYRVQLSADVNQPPLLDTVVSTPTLTLSDLPAGSTRLWRVAPVNGVSEAPFIPWLSFKIREIEDGTVTRTAVVFSSDSKPVQVSALVGLVSKDSTLSDVKVTLTEEKHAPLNLPPGFQPLSGRIDLDAKVGTVSVGDNQISITLTPPDTSLDGTKVGRGEDPMVYLLDSATGEVTVLHDLKKDSLGRILLPLSRGKSFILAVDTVAPVVKDATPVLVRESGSTPVISGQVDDNIRNCRTWLRYRQGGSETFDSVSVITDAKGHFEMPLALTLDSSGFEYNLVASDGRNRKITQSQELPVAVKALQAVDSLPSMQWRLFALPTIADGNQWSDLASTLGTYGPDWKLFERAPEGLKEFGPQLQKATPGAAYWLKSRARGFQPAITGGIVAPIGKPFVITLPPKSWRSFGNPFLFPVAWQSVLDSSHAVPGALVGPYTFRDSSWVPPLEIPALAPWEGYYAYNPTSDTVFIRIPSIRAKGSAGVLAKAAFHVQWQVRGSDGKDAGNYFGALPQSGPVAASAGAAAKVASTWAVSGVTPYPLFPSLWNVPKPVAPDAGLRAGFIPADDATGLLQTDFRTVSAEGGAAWTARLDGMKPGQRYTSRFMGLENLPEGVSVGLADPVTGHFRLWSPDAVYLVEAMEGETARDLQFFAGSPGYVASRGIEFAAGHPAAIELGNFPNPVRAFTIVRFAVPASASQAVPVVKLTVYDMQGRSIKVLAESRMGAGRHSLRWDVRDGQGRRVAAGMYRLLMEVGDKRMSRALHITF